MVDADTEPSRRRANRKRPRGLVACRRCKTRKQRCDNDFPSCSNCTVSGERCSYGAKQAYPAEYVRALEQQVSMLQSAAASPQHVCSVGQTGSAITPRRTLPPDDCIGTSGQGYSTRENGSLDLEASAGIVALSPDSFLGTASGFPLTKLLRSKVAQLGDQSNHVPSADLTSAGSSRSRFPVDGRRPILEERSGKGSDMPSPYIGDKLIDAYYERVHPKHPFLPRRSIQALHDSRDGLVPAHQQTNTPNSRKPCDYATLQLVYAIGARYLQLTNDDDHSSPGIHYASAMRDADVIFASGNLGSLEAMLLLTIYQLRSPTGPGVWWMVETTMRYCIDNGLHRRASNIAPSADQRRKRIFWTAYMLERSVSRTMGRPYSISDRDIDVDLPANVEDSLITDEEIRAAIADSQQNPARMTSLTPAIHIFRLQQIESRITSTVCRVDRDVSAVKPEKVAWLRSTLEEWKAGIPSAALGEQSHPYITNDYHVIQYHKAIVLLNLPFLSSLTPKDPAFQEIVDSAGQICCLSKRLHDQQTYISFSLLSLHANFIAGLVMVYCFCLDASIFSPGFSKSIRACSTMLYIVSERWPRAVQARNAFDRLVAATIENDQYATTSTGAGASAAVDARDEASDLVNALGEGHHEVWNSFESILGDYQINMGDWMHNSIFDTMSTFHPMDWME